MPSNSSLALAHVQEYHGTKLCERCWNGQHFVQSETNKQSMNCAGDPCECPCRELFTQEKIAERKAKKKKKKPEPEPRLFGQG